MRTVRNEKGRQIEEVLRKEKGENYVNDYGYLIYGILDELRKKNQAGFIKEEMSQGRLVEELPSFDYSVLSNKEIIELVEYGIKIRKNYSAGYPEMSVEVKNERVGQAIHDRIFDIEINDSIPEV